MSEPQNNTNVATKTSDGIFSGKVICFTGTLSILKRSEAEKLVLDNGGEVSSGVTKKVNLLVAGPDAGSKLAKAKELNIEIIDEATFVNMSKNAITEHKEKEKTLCQLNKEQKAIIKEAIDDEVLTKKQAKQLEEFVKNAAIPCYMLEIVEGNPTPLDSSIGGIPFCPVGEELPKDDEGNDIPLIIQINFEGVDQPGYPNKGIFQIFMDYNDFPEEGNNCIRYYEDISIDYRKDLKPSNHEFSGCDKIKLEKGWSMFPHARIGEIGDDDHLDEKLQELLESLAEEVGEDEIIELLDELFPLMSNIDGYGFPPNSELGIPYQIEGDDGIMLSLDCDLIEWGDSGRICFNYVDITKIKKDEQISVFAGMC
jgi:uncharacterized protein YwqG